MTRNCQPILTTSGCAGSPGTGEFFDVSRWRGRHWGQAAQAGQPTPRMAETASGMPIDRPAGAGHRRVPAARPAWLLSAAHGRGVVAGGTVGVRELAARLSDAARVTAIGVNISARTSRSAGGCSPTRRARDRRGARQDPLRPPVFAALAGRDRHRGGPVAWRPGRTGSDDQHAARQAIGQSCAGAGRTDRQAVRPGHPPVAVRCIWQVRGPARRPSSAWAGSGRRMLWADPGRPMVAVGTTIFHDPSAACGSRASSRRAGAARDRAARRRGRSGPRTAGDGRPPAGQEYPVTEET